MKRKGKVLQPITVLEARLKHFRWTRWGVTFVFALGIGLSVLLQVLHAPAAGGWVAMVVGGVPPVAVFLCVEMISRIPIKGAWGAITRVIIASAVAGMAIAVSYEQQYDYIGNLGFEGISVILFPLIIDGVMFVATLSLVEVTRMVRLLREEIAGMLVPVTSIPIEPEVVPKPVSTPPVVPPVAQSPGKRGRPPGPQNPPSRRRVRRPGNVQPLVKPNLREEPIEAFVISDKEVVPVAMGETLKDLVSEPRD